MSRLVLREIPRKHQRRCCAACAVVKPKNSFSSNQSASKCLQTVTVFSKNYLFRSSIRKAVEQTQLRLSTPLSWMLMEEKGQVRKVQGVCWKSVVAYSFMVGFCQGFL